MRCWRSMEASRVRWMPFSSAERCLALALLRAHGCVNKSCSFANARVRFSARHRMEAVKEARAAVKEALTELNAMAKDAGIIEKTCSLRCAPPWPSMAQHHTDASPRCPHP